MRITSTGLVGIGTSTPDTLTHISASAGATLRIEATTPALVANSVVGNIEFEANDASAQGTGIKASIGAYSDVAAGNEVSLRLHAGANTEATGTERYRITGDGQHIFGGVGGISTAERLLIDNNGFAKHTGAIGRGAPVTKTSAFTVGIAENWLICNGAASITVTLPTASAWTGREIMLKTIAAFTVISASSNVVPLAGGAAGTAILAATGGKYATLVSDGTNWIIMEAN
jgi:hypothetical protein